MGPFADRTDAGHRQADQLRALPITDPVVVALPVAPADTVRELAGHCDRLVCLAQPQPFVAVGLHYRRFPQVSDEEVMAFLKAAGQDMQATAEGSTRPDPGVRPRSAPGAAAPGAAAPGMTAGTTE